MDENKNEKLPISLVVICHNSGDKLKALIDKHKEKVSEVIVLDQGSTDNTYAVASENADVVVKRRHKGFCEPDREYVFALASQPYVLNLDDDEEIRSSSWEVVAKALKTSADIFWFRRENFVDGISIMALVGDDGQCRLWKKNAVKWDKEMHKYPSPAINTKVLYMDAWIDHFRTMEGLKAANAARNKVADAKIIEKQDGFVFGVEKYITEKKKENIKEEN